MADRRCQIIQIDFAAIPGECVVVATVANVLVEDRVVVDGHPASAGRVDLATLEELTFLDLQVDDSVLFVEAETGDDPVGGEKG
jgi:hypothetical protein